MIGLILIAVIAVLFFLGARKRGVNGFVYAALSVVAWYAGQITFVYFMILLNPRITEVGRLIWGLLGSALFVMLLYAIMESVAKKKAVNRQHTEYSNQ